MEPEPTLAADAAALAFPRYPGTAGDRRAIAWLERKLAAAGLEVAAEEFSYDLRPAWRAIRAVLAGSAVLVGGAALGAARYPAAALLAAAVALAAGGALLAWAPGIERVYRSDGPTRTANVVGRRPAMRPRIVLVLVAHHDSKSQNLSLPVRLGLTLVALGGGAVLVASLAVALLRSAETVPPWLGTLAGGIAAAALLGLSMLRSGNESPGGVDNAGSVAVLLELARRLPPRLPEDVELVVLSTGAEEDHMVGAMRWLDRHLPEYAGVPVVALNFDGAGAPGRTVVIERYGIGRAFAPELARAARTAAARLDIPVRPILMLPGIGIDAIPFAHRGVPCLTFSSGSLGRATMSVHSRHDVAEHLDPAALERVVRLAEAVALDTTGR